MRDEITLTVYFFFYMPSRCAKHRFLELNILIAIVEMESVPTTGITSFLLQLYRPDRPQRLHQGLNPADWCSKPEALTTAPT